MLTSKKHQGFTLLELMITIAIIGILASIAYPSYQEYVRKSKRAEGRVALMELIQQQERYMTQNNKYASFSETATDQPFKNFTGVSRLTAAFLIGARACNNQKIEDCVELYAKPSKYNDPFIEEITLTSTGVKSCSGSKPSVCWK
ncbi:MAG: type IV pilin protein [Comamonas sp.]|nr:type IV pilin protein [Comamonas sp.]